MKVLHVISSLDARSGGTSEACAGMALAQTTAGLNVRVLASMREGEDAAIVERLEAGMGNGKIRQVGPARGALARHPDLKQTVVESVACCDVVHIHGVWEEIQYLAAKRALAAGKPWIWAPHGMLDPWSLAQRKLKKSIYWGWRWSRLANRAAAIHFITRSEARLASPMFDPKFCQLIEPLGTELGSVAQAKPKEARLLFLSRIHPKKNLECLIRACAMVGDKMLTLTVAGTGEPEYQKAMEELAAELGIASRVRFVGDLRGREKAVAFQSAAIFCLPSHQENFGIVVIEALAAGLPVMLSPAVGLAEDLEGLEQVKVLAAEPGAWARGIEQILSDKGLAERAAKNGPDFVSQRFSWAAIGENWVGHYGKLLGEKK